MNLSDYIADMGRRAELAAAVDASPDYLWQLGVGHQGRKPSLALAKRIQEATGGLVTVVELLPELREAIESAGYVRRTARRAA